ncbi:MAG: CDP-alcohol phosphatidyltransferase family protein [Thermomicrobiales bacterium]
MTSLDRWFRTQWGNIESPSDWLSLVRLSLAPVLWMLAASRKRTSVGAGVAISAATDVLDGVIARRSGKRSPFGSQFDTVADMAIIVSAPGWMALLYPEVMRNRRRPLLALGIVAGVLMSFEWIEHRRVGNLHIHSARAAAVAGHLYVLNLFTRENDAGVLFHLFTVLAAGAAIESAWVIVCRGSLDELSETPLLDHIRAERSGKSTREVTNSRP